MVKHRKKKSRSLTRSAVSETSSQPAESTDVVATESSSPVPAENATDRSPATAVKPGEVHRRQEALAAINGAQVQEASQTPSSTLASPPDEALAAVNGTQVQGAPADVLGRAKSKFNELKDRNEGRVPPLSPSTSSLAARAVTGRSQSTSRRRIQRAASPDSGSPSATPAPPEVEFNRPSEGIGAAPAIVCSAGLVISAFVIFLSVKEALHSSTQGYSSSFCCPRDVEALVEYVNGSTEPCDSFFDFVCAGVVARRSDASAPTAMYSSPEPPRLNPTFELDVLRATNGTRSDVSTFLRSLFDSCLNTDANEKTALAEVVAALIRIAGDKLWSLTPANAFAYVLLTNVKYGIPSAILVVFQAVDAILVAHNPREGCKLSDKFLQLCLNYSVAELNRISRRQTKLNDVTAYAGSLDNDYEKDASLERYSGENATTLFEEWQVMPAFKAVSIGLGNVTVVDVSGLRQIDALFRALSVADRASRDAAASYFLASSACNALLNLQWRPTPLTPTKETFCMRLVDQMPNVRNMMYAVEFITPEKNLQVTRVVNSVIETIKSECTSSSVFGPNDTSLLRTFFDSMTLVLPQAVSVSGFTDTHFAQSLLEKVLRGRASEHETRLALARRGLPFERAESASRSYNYIQLQNGDNILVSPALYSLMRIDPAHTAVFNTPVIAMALAESIWSFILRETRLWSPAARAAIGSLVECFRDNYLTTGKEEPDIEGEIDTIAASLALSSVLKSFQEPDWYRVETAWQHWSMSHSRFFYMRETFFRCPLSSSVASKDNVDVPLMYVDSFSRVFQCQSSDRMMDKKACRFVEVLKSTGTST